MHGSSDRDENSKQFCKCLNYVRMFNVCTWGSNVTWSGHGFDVPLQFNVDRFRSVDIIASLLPRSRLCLTLRGGNIIVNNKRDSSFQLEEITVRIGFPTDLCEYGNFCVLNRKLRVIRDLFSVFRSVPTDTNEIKTNWRVVQSSCEEMCSWNQFTVIIY